MGPTIVARRTVLQSIGGFDRLKDYLAEDFVMGKLASEAGHSVILSSYVIEHHIGSAGASHNAAHRLRWARSTRRSRPLGYLGQIFTMPLPLALAVCALEPSWWPVLPLTFAVRAASAHMVAVRVLRSKLNWLLAARGGSGGFLLLAGRLLRQHDHLARSALPVVPGWPLRTGRQLVHAFTIDRIASIAHTLVSY